jgi:hypothetical protein
VIPSLLQYDRPVPAHWAEQLRAITPPDRTVSWLELVWESGGDVRPVHRWVIYEAIPAHAVTWWQQEMLLEEPVESAGHHRILRRYLQDGVLLQPFWVIQGSGGGHKVEFNDTEKKLLHHRGLPSEPPAAGDLPYAEFDQRVVRQVMKWDRLRQGYDSIQHANRLGRKAMERQFREELVAWLAPQVEGAVETEAHDVEWSSVHRAVDHEPDFGEALDAYVETGQLTA